MSIREMAVDIIDNFSEEQLKGFVMMFGNFDSEIPSEELLEALAEGEEMKKHPERYKRYSDVDEMMRDILNDI